MQSAQPKESISSFVSFQEGESIQREYYVAHTTLKRFGSRTILFILLGLSMLIVPGVILIIYFSVRRLKISYGHASITDKRVIYYEYNAHPHENYRYLSSLHLADITGLYFRIDQSLFKKSFVMSIYTEKKGMHVGAEGFLGFLRLFGKQNRLEPGPDAVKFVQEISGLIAGRKFGAAGGSTTTTP